MNPYNALISVLALAGLWFFLFNLWRDYRLDAFREDIFSIRDSMFLYAAKENISFHHPAYTILRARMNAILRYAHEFTMARVLLLLRASTHLDVNESTERWERAVATLPIATQAEMRRFSLCVSIFAAQHILYCSFFRYVLIRPFMLFGNPFDVDKMIKKRTVVEAVEHLESDVVEQDSRNESQIPVAV
jgi:hypothetical protein